MNWRFYILALYVLTLFSTVGGAIGYGVTTQSNFYIVVAILNFLGTGYAVYKYYKSLTHKTK